MKIGVLSLQGTFIEHINSVNKLGIEAVEIRLPEQLSNINGIIIPGGESTTITYLMHYYGLVHPLKILAKQGIPFLGTCAGMICMACNNHISAAFEPLNIMDIKIMRNAFGRQRSSFEEPLEIPALGDQPFPGLFIRGPRIVNAGKRVKILACLNGNMPVAVRQGNLIATAFHPELVKDLRLHEYYLEICLLKQSTTKTHKQLT